MLRPRRTSLRLSVQTKVLLAVIGFLVLLPTVSLWIVNRHISGQMQEEARDTLTTAETVFLRSLELRARDLLTRYRHVVNEPRLRAALQTNDPQTTTVSLNLLLEELGGDAQVVLYTTARDDLLAGSRIDGAVSTERFSELAHPFIEAALDGEQASGSLSVDNRAFNVISLPVVLPEGALMGVLTIGVRIGEAAVQELKSLTRTEILLLDEEGVIVSTLPAPDAEETLRTLSRQTVGNGEPVVVDGEHFLAIAREYEQGAWGGQGFRYVLLSSYQKGLLALEVTRRTLVSMNVAGLLLSAGIVWLVVRRVTQPLRELHDSAEAVARGDFSHRIERFSNDECGDLADAFNRMISSLQHSRDELEKTVETLKATQAQLVQSEKLSAVGQFVAGVAHELNNPLTAVIGFADLLCQTTTDPKVRPQLDTIAKSAHRCHKIVHSLLSFARQHVPERKLVKVEGLLDEVVEIMAYDLRTNNVEVVREFGTGLPPIMGDPHQLQQVFLNILSNARQALQGLSRSGRIVLRTRAENGRLRLEFDDNGPGIRPEHVSRIFDPFFTTKPVGQGTGLGMSLSYGIIQEHGGTIRVESEPDQGARFIIELPVAQEGEPSLIQSEHGSTPPLPRPEGLGRSVLVVDDEEWIVDLTRDVLTRDGYAVETADSGKSAVEAIARRKFDVIVSDWKMPGMNGIQLHDHLKVHDPALARRIIFMTGDVINATFQEYLNREARRCLMKPFSIHDFRRAIAEIVVPRD